MQKIAFVIDTMHPGGSERVISVLANGLSQKSVCVTIICLRGDSCFYKLDKDVDIIYLEKDYNTDSFFKKLFILRSYINNSNFDVIIPFMTGVYTFTLLSLLGLGKTIICSERIDPRATPLVRKFLRLLLLPTAAHLVVQTEQIKSYYPRSIQKKCSIIYNPVSDTFFEDRHFVQKSRFVSVGRLAPQKNQQMLIDAFGSVYKKHPEYSLSIFGEGPLKDELNAYIEAKNLQNAIRLEGTSSDISKELQSSFAFCLTSDFEGMSNAMIEALCAGIPLISTNVSGAKELLGENEGGIIVPVRDTEAFAAAMNHLIESPDAVERMRGYNLKKREEFRTEQIVNKWLEIIERFSVNERKK